MFSAKALALSLTLETLIASHNYIGPYGIIALANNLTLQTLDFSYNDIKTREHSWSKPYILERNLRAPSDFDYPRDCIQQMMTELAKNKALKKLNISNMRHPFGLYLNDEYLVDFINNNASVDTLDISHYGYGVQPSVLDAIARHQHFYLLRFTANLNAKDSQNIVSHQDNKQFFKLFTAQCSEGHYVSSAGHKQWTEELQRKYQSIFYAIYALRNYTSIGTISFVAAADLIIHIGSFLTDEKEITEIVDPMRLHQHSIFHQKIKSTEPERKKQKYLPNTEVNTDSQEECSRNCVIPA